MSARIKGNGVSRERADTAGRPYRNDDADNRAHA